MTQSVPDGVSTADLEDFAKKAKKSEKKAAKQAKKEAKKAMKGDHDGLTADQVIDTANKMLDKLYDKCGSPIIHKVAAMQVIHNLMRWHVNMAESCAESGEPKQAAAWAADAGRLKVALDTMRAVGINSDDFTFRPDNEFRLFPQEEE